MFRIYIYILSYYISFSGIVHRKCVLFLISGIKYSWQQNMSRKLFFLKKRLIYLHGHFRIK